MRKQISPFFRMTAMSVALSLAYGPAVAEDADVIALTKPESSISLGIGRWSKDRPQQGIHDGMREGDNGYGLLEFSIRKREDETGTWLNFSGSNTGDTRELKAEWLRQGAIGVSVEYSRTQRDNPMTFRTGLQGIGTTSMTISGAGVNALPFSDVTLGTNRDRLGLTFYKNIMPGLDSHIKFQNEDKKGTLNYGLGSQPLFMVNPIDSTIRQLEVTLSYSRERLQLNGGYYGTWYMTNNPLVWGLQNGVTQPGSVSSPNPTPLTQPLDNQAHQFFIDGGYSFTPTTRGTFRLSYAKATQDETFPTYSLAAPNDRFINTPSNLSGRIDTTLAELGITSRPLPLLSLRASLRYHDMDDKTPTWGIVGSNVTGVATDFHTPHSYQTTTGKVEATYRLPQNMSLIGGIDERLQKRSAPNYGTLFVPFRTEIDETTYRLQLRRNLSETVNGSVGFAHSDRDGSVYTPGTDEPTIDNLLNPMHIADRKRDKWRAMLDWSPTDRLTFQFAYEDARDRYATDKPYGLRDGGAKLYSTDMNFKVSEQWELTAWYSRDDTRARESGWREGRTLAQENIFDADKDASLREIGDAFGLALRGKPRADLKVGVNLEAVHSVTKYNQTVLPAAVDRLPPPATGTGTYPVDGAVRKVAAPDIKNQLFRVKLFAEYSMNKTSDLRFDLIHERWHTDDWTWTFADGSPFTYGTTTDRTIVMQNPRQYSTFLGVRYIYKFK